MAAAAAWTVARHGQGVNVFVASDHHIPDLEAFRDAALSAAATASDGRIVTLGVKPREASSAYGYIRPAGPGLSAVEAFIEKPDAANAAKHVAAGYLWNSGNFVVSADTLMSELRAHAPAVAAAAEAAIPVDTGRTVESLTDEFCKAPKISIDYALMEKTQLASVLEVDFAWSDLGAWDAIAASGEGDTGLHILEDSEGCVLRSCEGVMIAAIGVRNLAIVAEPDAILVCDLSRAQDVKKVVDRLKVSLPQFVDFPKADEVGLAAEARCFTDWMRLKALPLWATIGQSEDGAFAELIAMDGRTVPTTRRARVQARQIYVYAQAGRLGWTGPWRRTVETGAAELFRNYIRADGLSRTLLSAGGAPVDETAMVYDLAFIMFALAMAHAAGLEEPSLEGRAVMIRDHLMGQMAPNGAVTEAAPPLHQSNCHMHLFEAALAWEAESDDPAWAAFSDRLAALAMSTFIDGEGGFLREFFGPDWMPAPGEDGRLVEPGHQFEWAWLLARYGRLRGEESAVEAARRLFAFGLRGISETSGAAVDALNEDGAVRSKRARLWPQTEWLKASLILAEVAHDGDRLFYLDQAAAALRALRDYLTPEGLWHDKRLPDRSFIDEPAPASSLYHIMAACGQLIDTGHALGIEGINELRLG
jgi:mannose/cellobiose epimerase-like protein (N-acyl-D-glucosamine 2-epimerase family)